uniref:Eukaryotic translation initiation factor 1 n=4 Tax=Aves TaxID=8782 RepID=A0A8B9FQH9_9PSIT
MSAIQNLQPFDPFADASKGDDLLPAGTEDYIHIRIQQRNGRKTLTTVQGIADDYDKKKLVKAFKKKFACNGTVIEHPEYGEVIQLQGDQRKNICQFLVEVGWHRTTKSQSSLGLKGPQTQPVPISRHGQGHLPLEQLAPSPVQPGLEHCRGWGSHSFSGHPVPAPQHPHKEELPQISSQSALWQVEAILSWLQFPAKCLTTYKALC